MFWCGSDHSLVDKGLKACGCKVFSVKAEGYSSFSLARLVQEDEDVSIGEIELRILETLQHCCRPQVIDCLHYGSQTNRSLPLIDHPTASFPPFALSF